MNPLNNQRGIALLLTLVVLVLLTAVIVEFDYGAKINLITAGNFRDEIQATYLAKAGATAARAALKDDAENSTDHDGLDELWAQPVSLPVGEGFVSGEITDEADKIDVNRLGNSSPQVSGDAQEMLERLLRVVDVDSNMRDPIVGAIKHWVDPEPLHDCEEDSYYQRLDPPYRCKKAPMDTLSELLLVKGVTPEIYRKVRPYLTTVSMKDHPININTADLPVLRVALGEAEVLSEETAMCIKDGRPYKTVVFGCGYDCPVGSRCRRLVSFKSSFFTVKAHGIMHETEKIVTALIKRDGTKTSFISWQIE
jgi:general secretion pathway protein K